MSKIVGTVLLLGLLLSAILSVILIVVQWVRSSDTSTTKKAAVVYTVSAPTYGLVESSTVVKAAPITRQIWTASGLDAMVINFQFNLVQAVVTTPQLLSGS